MKTLITIIFLISVSILAGCSSSESYSPKEYELNRTWELQNLGGTQATTANWPNGLPWMELKVNKSEFGGNTGCNGMGGTVFASKDMIIFGNIIATRMFCEGVDEGAFIAALENAGAWTIENDRLFLYDSYPNGVVLAVFSMKAGQ